MAKMPGGAPKRTPISNVKQKTSKKAIEPAMPAVKGKKSK